MERKRGSLAHALQGSSQQGVRRACKTCAHTSQSRTKRIKNQAAERLARTRRHIAAEAARNASKIKQIRQSTSFVAPSRREEAFGQRPVPPQPQVLLREFTAAQRVRLHSCAGGSSGVDDPLEGVEHRGMPVLG